MYRVIGADGKEYGPFTAEQVQQWMAQGRLNAHSQMSLEGSGEWKPLNQFPEFTAPPKLETPMSKPVDQSAVMRARARDEVEGPATALLVIGILDVCQQLFSLVMGQVAMMAALRGGTFRDPMYEMFNSGPIRFIGVFLGIAVAVLIIAGALKMKKMESYDLSLAASILMVLTKPHVKEAFKYRASQ